MPPLRARSEPRGGGGAGALRLPAAALGTVRAHAEAAYPEECCGAMLGRDSGDAGAAREVVRVVPAENRWSGGRGARFLIPAAAVRVIGEEAAREGLALVGFYHSHPGGKPEPSRVDREEAWPWYSYLIVAVSAAGAGEARCWRLADDRRAFLPESMRIEGRSSDSPSRG